MQSLLARDNDAAVAAGVNLLLSAGTMAAICQLQALSPVGRCKTFDESADGYGRGEGLAVIVLQAFRGNNTAIAIIRGSAANQVEIVVPIINSIHKDVIIMRKRCMGIQCLSRHTSRGFKLVWNLVTPSTKDVVSVLHPQDGRSSGLTAPNGPAQSTLINMTLKCSRAISSEVALVSVHGTGTPLGDPIEIGALGKGLSNNDDRAQPLILLSNKSRFGHTEGSAGRHTTQLTKESDTVKPINSMQSAKSCL